MAEKVIELKNISVFFKQAEKTVKAVNDVSIEVEKGDIFGVVGYSGAGKSTLVRTINLLQKPTAGEVVVNGKTLFSKNGNKETLIEGKELRQARREIGMIFQHFNLLEEKTVSQNVEFALKHSSLKEKQIASRAQELLKLVGLETKGSSYPAQLSGGQQQRVAIARALANNPEILISDEATSALDPKNTVQILDLLKNLNKKLGLTVVLITHEMDAVKRIAKKVAVMSSGKIIERGNLIDIFVNAKQPLTQELVGIQSQIQKAEQLLAQSTENSDLSTQTALHLTYTGNSVKDPVMTKLYADYGVQTSIIFGNVDVLRDEPVGTLFVIVSGKEENRQKAIEYLKSSGIKVSKIDLSKGVAQ